MPYLQKLSSNKYVLTLSTSHGKRLLRLAAHGKQGGEDGRAQTRRGVPAAHGVEARTADARAPADGARGDVGQGGAGVGVEPGVQEAEAALAVGDAVAVDELDDAGEGGRGAAGAVDEVAGAVDDDDEVGGLGGDVGVRAARGVEVAGDGVVGRVGGQPRADGVGLVAGLAEERREAAAAVGPGGLGRDAVGAADGGDPGARGGEGRDELLDAVLGAAAGRPDARVAGGDEDGHAARAELREEVARGRGVVVGHGGLVVAVRDGERVGELVVVQVQEVAEELAVGLVRVRAGADPLA